ncbi:MAG: LptF/LptG family permease, partial [Elusimicrobiota bacterium]
FLSPFFWAIISFLVIMTVVHFFDFMHTFLKHKPPLELLLKYFGNRIPEWFVLIIPVATLVATLFSLGNLKNNNELIAIKSSGIRLLYVLKPLVIFSIFVSIFSGGIAEFVVPTTTPRADNLFAVIKGDKSQKVEKRRKDFTYMDEHSKIFFIKEFDGENEITGLTVTVFYPGTTIEKERYTAARAIYTGEKWKLIDSTVRTFSEDGSTMTSFTEEDEKYIDLNITPKILRAPPREPEELGLLALYKYIQKLQAGGRSTTKEKVLLHHKIAFPFSNTIILLLGIPLALFGGFHSRTAGFFISLIISFIYWGTISVGRSLGAGGSLPPLMAAWSANTLFLLISLGMMKKVKLF